jgi:molybdopterin converting factor small subunit
MVQEDSNGQIQVKVKLFAVYQEVFGTPELELKLLPETTIEQLLASLIEQQPQLTKWRHALWGQFAVCGVRYGVAR